MGKVRVRVCRRRYKIISVDLPNLGFAVCAIPPGMTVLGLKAALGWRNSIAKLHHRPLGEMEEVYKRVYNFDVITIEMLSKLSWIRRE